MQASYLHRHNQSQIVPQIMDPNNFAGRVTPQISQGTPGQLNASGNNLIKSYDSNGLQQHRAQASLSISGVNNLNSTNNSSIIGQSRDNSLLAANG
jgi:hypothetical protein